MRSSFYGPNIKWIKNINYEWINSLAKHFLVTVILWFVTHHLINIIYVIHMIHAYCDEKSSKFDYVKSCVCLSFISFVITCEKRPKTIRVPFKTLMQMMIIWIIALLLYLRDKLLMVKTPNDLCFYIRPIYRLDPLVLYFVTWETCTYLLPHNRRFT